MFAFAQVQLTCFNDNHGFTCILVRCFCHVWLVFRWSWVQISARSQNFSMDLFKITKIASSFMTPTIAYKVTLTLNMHNKYKVQTSVCASLHEYGFMNSVHSNHNEFHSNVQCIPYSAKFSCVFNFANFVNFQPFMKIFQ